MPDREKVIKALEYCTENCEYMSNCPYSYDCHGGDPNGVSYQLLADALTLLREQKPVTMKPSYFNYVCSGCGSEIDGEFIEYTGGKIKFCPWCGKAVKWNG